MKPNVIIGTESWLIPDHKENGILNSEIFPEGYKLSMARRDRQDIPLNADNLDIRWGGTFVLVDRLRKNIAVKHMLILFHKSKEFSQQTDK